MPRNDDNTAFFLGAAAALAVVTLVAAFGGACGSRSREGFHSAEAPVVQYFRMDTCPHCKRFDGVWEQLKAAGAAAMPGVRFEQHDASSDEAREHGVRSFPHIQMIVAGGEPVVFEGSRDVETLKDFVAGAGR
jgi:thioredoxin-like negative regulator of GroEL